MPHSTALLLFLRECLTTLPSFPEEVLLQLCNTVDPLSGTNHLAFLSFSPGSSKAPAFCHIG
eukprot:10523310-Prorocentrum_lima.AAC.1